MGRPTGRSPSACTASRYGPHVALPAARAGRGRLPRRGAVPARLRPDRHPGRRALPGRSTGPGRQCAARGARGRDDAVIIGHDWGALATYGAVAHQPDRWRRAVTAAVPPTASIGMSLFTYAQLQRSWYMFFFQSPWPRSRSPWTTTPSSTGSGATGRPATTARGTWPGSRSRSATPSTSSPPSGTTAPSGTPRAAGPELADEQAAALLPTPKPTLYLHGRERRLHAAQLDRQPARLPGRRLRVESGRRCRPLPARGATRVVNRRILDFLTTERP
jgi:pimeloyl-ACP methyl ester carboxylesterase